MSCAAEFSVSSPNGLNEIAVATGTAVTFRVAHNAEVIVAPSPISLNVGHAGALGIEAAFTLRERTEGDEEIATVAEKRKVVRDRYREIVLDSGAGYGLVLRAYDDGVAYRWFTEFNDVERIRVTAEEATFVFSGDHALWAGKTELHSSFESIHQQTPLSEFSSDELAFAPVLVAVAGGPRIAITEADLLDYPGMFITRKKGATTTLVGKFAPYALEETMEGDRKRYVSRAADYIAETSGNRMFPWRVLIVADKDRELLDSDMVYKLSSPCRIQDTSWIRPGKVAWDWWNAWGLEGVDFEAGINTPTYRYFIDFAAANSIEYVILDEGWSNPTDLFDVNKDIDLQGLIRYAEERKVGLILWCIWAALDDQLDEALATFAQWGIKGIKVDFMDRDDQAVVNYYERVARKAARHHLLVDFHGAYKPTGLRRQYPNLITREGILGLEYAKWSSWCTPQHSVTAPFIRMLAGPMDYTPGAMSNAQKGQFKAVFTKPMSQGTRCHQLAMFVAYDSPLQMLADSPTAYEKEPHCLKFLADVPSVWDNTRALDGAVGEYLVMARQKGDEWYIGAMSAWDERDLAIELSFLGEGKYQALMIRDGPSASIDGTDHVHETQDVNGGSSLDVHLAPGGGWVCRLSPR